MNPELSVSPTRQDIIALKVTEFTRLMLLPQPFILLPRDGEVKLRVDKQDVLLILVL